MALRAIVEREGLAALLLRRSRCCRRQADERERQRHQDSYDHCSSTPWKNAVSNPDSYCEGLFVGQFVLDQPACHGFARMTYISGSLGIGRDRETGTIRRLSGQWQ